MTDQSVQLIASHITLLSVSLLATALIVLFPTWRRFQKLWTQAPIECKRLIVRGSLVPVGIPVVVLMAALISLWAYPKTWYLEMPYVLLLLLFALTLPFYVIAVPRWVWRKFKKVNQTDNIAPAEDLTGIYEGIGATSALVCFLFVIFLTLVTISASTPLMIDVQVGGHSQKDDYEAARAFITIAPFMLTAGMGWLGFSFGVEFFQATKTSTSD